MHLFGYGHGQRDCSRTPSLYSSTAPILIAVLVVHFLFGTAGPATGTEPAHIVVTPDSLSAELEVRSSEIQQLTISNSGDSVLTWQAALKNVTAHTKNISDLTGKRILLELYHCGDNVEQWSRMLDELTGAGAEVTVNEQLITRELLTNFDALWIVRITDLWDRSEIDAAIEWIRSGGAVLMSSERSLSAYVFNEILSGVGSGISIWATPGTSGLVSEIYDHPTTADIDSLYILDAMSHIESVGISEQPLLLDHGGQICAACAGAAVGRVVVVTDNLFQGWSADTEDTRRFCRQVFQWLVEPCDGVFIEPNTGVAPSGGSETVDVIFDATSLLAIQYDGQIEISSNDPNNPQSILPFSMNVVGGPDIALSPSSLALDVQAGTATDQYLSIANDGLLDLEWSVEIDVENQGAKRPYSLHTPATHCQDPDLPADGSSGTSTVAKTNTVFLSDLTGIRIVRDDAHGQDYLDGWSTFVAHLESRGASVAINHSFVTDETFAECDLFWITDCRDLWNEEELDALVSWTRCGGSLLLEGDNGLTVPVFNQILAALNSGISFSDENGASGVTTDILPHTTTAGVDSLHIGFASATIATVPIPSGILVRDTQQNTCVAYASIGWGKLVTLSDELTYNHVIGSADNLLLGHQLVDWLANTVPSILLDPRQGVVPAGGSCELSLGLRVPGGCQGLYCADISFTCNDPYEPYPILPVSLSIRPAATGIDIDEGSSGLLLTDLHTAPNPFNPATEFRFTLGSAASVSIRIYDVKGALVCDLPLGYLSAGAHRIPWRPHDQLRISSCTYIYQLLADGFPLGQTRKLCILK